MSGGSLRLRLFATGAVALAAALAVAGVAMTWLFQRHLERRAIADAQTHLRTLVAGASLSGETIAFSAQPQDPRFADVYGGQYWQAQEGAAVLARSRSLWDTTLALPADALSAEGRHIHTLVGPRRATLLALEQGFVLTGATGPRHVRLVVAQDVAEIRAARNAFARDLTIGLALLAAALMAASIVQIRIGLKPLAAIRDQINAIRSGARPRLDDAFPTEVTPLVAEINALLGEREGAVARARGRAADLAHGLKTPLAALASHVRRLREAGQQPVADDISALGAMMERHVQRELARARIGPGRAGGARVRLRAVAELVASAVARAPAADGKTFDFDIDPALTLPLDRADLEELLGNLLENAARHARSAVAISAAAGPPVVICVSDDGEGVAPQAFARLLERGERLDASGAGAGLGLAIVGDIVEAYGGALSLRRAELGGLCVALTLPAA